VPEAGQEVQEAGVGGYWWQAEPPFQADLCARQGGSQIEHVGGGLQKSKGQKFVHREGPK